PGAADEAHRARAGAVGRRGLLLGVDDLGAQRHAEIAVGIHAQKFFIALALDQVARPAPVARRNDLADRALRALEPSALPHLVEPCRERARQSLGRHRSVAFLW